MTGSLLKTKHLTPVSWELLSSLRSILSSYKIDVRADFVDSEELLADILKNASEFKSYKLKQTDRQSDDYFQKLEIILRKVNDPSKFDGDQKYRQSLVKHMSNPNYDTLFAFASYDIVKDLSSRCTGLSSYQGRGTDTIFKLAMCLEKIDQQSLRELNVIYRRWLSMTHLVKNGLIPQGKNRKCEFQYYPSNIIKIWPSATTTIPPPILDIRHVNSAVRYDNQMGLFRREEILKLSLHETIHCLEVELTPPPPKRAPFQIKKIGMRDQRILVNESLVEALAAVLNIMMTAAEIMAETSLSTNTHTHTPTHTHDLNYYVDLVQELWSWERIFQLLQSAKILRMNGFRTIQEWLNGKDPIKEASSAVEYHILKSALLFDTRAFLHQVTTPQKQSEFTKNILKLVWTGLEHPEYQKMINKLIQLKKIPTKLSRTGRMTLIEKRI